MNRICLSVLGFLPVLMICATAAAADKTDTQPGALISPRKSVPPLDPSLAKEVDAAITRALDWLAASQKENGSWSNSEFPALTAFGVWSFANSNHPKKKEVLDKALKYLLSCARADGGIYCEPNEKKTGGGLSNYNTSICGVALYATGRPELIPIIQKARKFVAAGQHFGDDMYDGGFGYDRDNKRTYTDLLNSVWSFEMMRTTADVETVKTGKEARVDIDWEKAREYLKRIQNKESTGADNAGGFPYRPDESKAGATNVQGKVVLRSYGSMTYAGLLGLIYADATRTDPRVQSAFDWARNNWSLEENPGMGHEGLYFFYHVVTKALAAYGEERVPTKDARLVPWRVEIIKKLMSLQKTETNGQGYWLNETGRFWESDKVLCTGYSIIALQIASGL